MRQPTTDKGPTQDYTHLHNQATWSKKESSHYLEHLID